MPDATDGFSIYEDPTAPVMPPDDPQPTPRSLAEQQRSIQQLAEEVQRRKAARVDRQDREMTLVATSLERIAESLDRIEKLLTTYVDRT